MISRRDLIAAIAGLACAPVTAVQREAGGRTAIQSVTGAIAADRLGTTLMHEHVLVDFIGADKADPARYDRDEVFKTVLPHLTRVRALGCTTLVECTPAYLGRDPVLLRRLSDASGVQILTNTGYYGAAKDKHLPAHAFTETAERLAERWTREWRDGIDGTGIKPAFMKIGVDGAPLSEVDAKVVRAAALTARATGLPIASHTGTGAAAVAELEILAQSGVPASTFIWVHAHGERETAFHDRVAKAGAWVEFDGVAPGTVARHVELVVRMKTQGLLGRVLVSHDAGWFNVGDPGGGRFRPFDTLFTDFVPALTAAGLSRADVDQLLVQNPREALTPRARV